MSDRAARRPWKCADTSTTYYCCLVKVLCDGCETTRASGLLRTGGPSKRSACVRPRLREHVRSISFSERLFSATAPRRLMARPNFSTAASAMVAFFRRQFSGDDGSGSTHAAGHRGEQATSCARRSTRTSTSDKFCGTSCSTGRVMYFILISPIGTDFNPSPLTTIGPLSARAVVDDQRVLARRRRRSRGARACCDASLSAKKWQDVRVGDVVEVRAAQPPRRPAATISTAKPRATSRRRTCRRPRTTRRRRSAAKHLQTAEAVAAMVGRATTSTRVRLRGDRSLDYRGMRADEGADQRQRAGLAPRRQEERDYASCSTPAPPRRNSMHAFEATNDATAA